VVGPQRKLVHHVHLRTLRDVPVTI
jgi:hypothetical protein